VSPTASVWVSGFERPEALRSGGGHGYDPTEALLGPKRHRAGLCPHHRQDPDNPDTPDRKRPDRSGARLGLGWVSGFGSPRRLGWLGSSGLAGRVRQRSGVLAEVDCLRVGDVHRLRIFDASKMI